jgi:hypothetical protein
MQKTSRSAFFVPAITHVGVGHQRCSYARSSAQPHNSAVDAEAMLIPTFAD